MIAVLPVLGISHFGNNPRSYIFTFDFTVKIKSRTDWDSSGSLARPSPFPILVVIDLIDLFYRDMN